MTREEIEYMREQGRENDIAKMSNQTSQAFANRVRRLFHTLNIDKDIQELLNDDISSGEIYNIFRMFDIDTARRTFSAIATIYSHYKEKHEKDL